MINGCDFKEKNLRGKKSAVEISGIVKPVAVQLFVMLAAVGLRTMCCFCKAVRGADWPADLYAAHCDQEDKYVIIQGEQKHSLISNSYKIIQSEQKTLPESSSYKIIQGEHKKLLDFK